MLIAGGGAYATVSPVFLTIYSIFIGGILGAASLYMTGNISEKILAGKVNASVEIARKKKKRVEPVIQGE
jgi:membrane protein DedA with SNARE-associated domain